MTVDSVLVCRNAVMHAGNNINALAIDLLTAVGVEINDLLETSGQYTTATANFNPNTYP